MRLVEKIYKYTKDFPAYEKYGLVSQMRRAAVSIPSNIAEGAARQGKKEFKNFLSISQGSLSELDTQLELSKRLGFIDDKKTDEIEKELIRVDKMLSGLIRNISK